MHLTGSVKFSKEAPLGAAAPQAPQTDAAGGAGSGVGQGRGARAPVMWGGARSAAARDMLAGLGLAGSGLSLPGAWGPGLDLGRLVGLGAEVRLWGQNAEWTWNVACECKVCHLGWHSTPNAKVYAFKHE